MNVQERTYDDMARAYLAKGIAMFGLPSSGPVYDGNLRALVDPALHNFRLSELPTVTRDPGITQRPLRFLDLGCGPGTFVYHALERGHDAYGIDLSEEKVELGWAWAGARSLSQASRDRLIVADGGDLPFDDGFFDVVTSYHVLEHVADLPSVLFEAVRVTKRGGWLELRAPDYRMSYDTHYSMPWPRFMPPEQSRKWARAMGRPSDGVGSFFYVTAPQVIALLQALGCEIVTCVLREHRDSAIHPFTGSIGVDPVIFRSDADIASFAAELRSLEASNRLPDIYKTCLEFTIAARRL